MEIVIPQKLKSGDEIRVIAPVRSVSLLSSELKQIATERLIKMGFKVSFGKNIEPIDEFQSNPIKQRIKDLHDAFLDPSVKGILTVIGGFNSNQLLRYINWGIIKNNPKVFCGFSDVTALNNSILAKTGLVTYSGPHYSTFGQKLYFDYTLDYFKRCLMSPDPIEVKPSDKWSDDEWYFDQNRRVPIKNSGWWIINEGVARGVIIGGNLCTFNLLHGTEYLPSLNNTVLFIEDDSESQPHHFDRDLQSIIHQHDFSGIKGIVIGRLQKESNMTLEKMRKIIQTKSELNNLTVIANVDFGHTDPKITYPIGGYVEISANSETSSITITKH